MMMFKKTLIGGVSLATGLMLGLAGVALSQDSPAPPSWSVLVRCAQTPSEDARLACYDAAMRAAGFAPKPEAVAAEHRKVFGLSMPKVSVLKHRSKEEGAESAEAESGAPRGRHGAAAPAEQVNPDRVTVVIDKVALQGNQRMLFITEDGAIWEQTDDVQIEPFPKSGQSMDIRRNVFGGYFCDATKQQPVRCKRDR